MVACLFSLSRLRHPISMSRFILFFLLIFTLLISAYDSRAFKATPVTLHEQISLGGHYQGFRLLGALRLNSTEIDQLSFCGLSGLAWDEDAGLLYALSDKGTLFHLKPAFDAQGYLVDLQPVAGYPLRDPTAKPLRRPFHDSEGLVIRQAENGIQHDSQLLISFEVKPRLVWYGTHGQGLGEAPLPRVLRNPLNFRQGNQSLEAVTLDSRWGALTGSETPLRNDPPDLIRLFTTGNRFWLYRLGRAPGSALVAMETLPDGGLLTLERAFVSPLQPFSISLRWTQLPKQNKQAPLPVRDIAVFKSDEGWLLDNFEGLARYRDHRFFMISDDNCSNFQSTLLVYFELPTLPNAEPR